MINNSNQTFPISIRQCVNILKSFEHGGVFEQLRFFGFVNQIAYGSSGYWHAYKYSYDNLNRLTAGNYTCSATTSDATITYGTANGHNNENYQYDVMGNITALNRYNYNTKITELAYTYIGNRATKIVNTGTSSWNFPIGASNYTYDNAGRLKTDSGRKITEMKYNHLGLPTSIKYGSAPYNYKEKYTYDATGRKLKSQMNTYTPKYYMDGVEYKNDQLQLNRNSAPFYVIGSIPSFCNSSTVFRVTSALCQLLLIFTIFTSERNSKKSAGEYFLLSSYFLSMFRIT